MRQIKTISLTGEEKAAKDIYTKSGVVLIPKGSVIRKEYVEKLIELGIFAVWIEERISGNNEANVELAALERVIRQDCEKKIKSTMEKFYISQSHELSEVKKIAESIITEVISNPEVLLNVTGIRNKSEALYTHCVNVCTLSVLFAVKLKLKKSLVKMIAIGSLLHDIGMKYVDSQYLNYANEIADMEIRNSFQKEYKKHVIYGYDMVKDEDWISDEARDVILYHHERLDGSGYPMHLQGRNLDIGPRIVAVSDEFDNLIYVEKMKVHEAIEKIIAGAGREFDFDVVKVFNESVAAYPNGTQVITSDDEVGIVFKQNIKCPARPVIKIIKDSTGMEVKPYIRDMTKELSLFIKDTIE